MVSTLRRSTTRLSVTLLLIVSLISVAAPIAFASDGPDRNPQERKRRAVTTEAESSTTSNSPSAPSASVQRKTISVGYALYDNAITIEPPPVAISNHDVSVKTIPQTKGKASSGKQNNSVVSTAPMSPREKFNYFLRRSFFSVTPYALSIYQGVVGEATDNDHGRHMTAGDFMADSMTHAARSFAFRATSNFFEKFAFATVLRQDPRYHRSPGKRSAGARVLYAATRVFVTQGDRCGCNQPNFSFLGGGLATAGLAEQWVRPEDRGLDRVFARWGSHIGVRMFTNLLSEFIGGQ